MNIENLALGITIVLIMLFCVIFEFVSVQISKLKRKCEDCGCKNNLIISRYTITSLTRMINPSEYRCNYHYRLYHHVTHDDFTTELDDKELVELRKLTSSL